MAAVTGRWPHLTSAGRLACALAVAATACAPAGEGATGDGDVDASTLVDAGSEPCPDGTCVQPACSPSRPDGLCPAGQTCEAGACVPEPLSVTISSPAPGTSVEAGTGLRVELQIRGGRPFEVLVTGAGNSVLLEQPQPPFTVSLPVPPEAIGPASLSAFATFDTGAAFSGAIPLTVEVSATLQTIRVLDDDQYLRSPNATRQLTVFGHYSDGVRRNITSGQVGTIYSVSRPIASVTADGLITALAPGDATLAVRNGQALTSVAITVGEP